MKIYIIYLNYYDRHNNTKMESISITLTTTITAKSNGYIMTKVTVVMTNMITKIRMTILITEKNNNSNSNGNNTAIKVTIEALTISK